MSEMQALLMALHDFVGNALQPALPASPAAPMQAVAAQPQGGGLLSRFRGGGFGQAMTQGIGMGAGFGRIGPVSGVNAAARRRLLRAPRGRRTV